MARAVDLVEVLGPGDKASDGGGVHDSGVVDGERVSVVEKRGEVVLDNVHQ